MQCVITCTFWVYTEVLLCICVIFWKKKKKEKGAVKQSTLKKKSLVLKKSTKLHEAGAWYSCRWSVLHLIKAPSNPTFLSVRAYLAWRGSEKHAGLFWRGFLQREKLRVGVLKKKKI